MSFNKLTAFTQKVADAADQITGNPVLAKSIFDNAPEELRTYFNNLVDALKSTASGDSGAKNTGATAITGLTGTDVQTLLEALNTADASRVKTTSTGMRLEIAQATFFTNGGSSSSTATVTFSTAFTSKPKVMPMNIEIGDNISYSDSILYPNITNVTTTGFTAKIKAQGGNLGTLNSPANILFNFLVFGN
jgi:hypothetical protein